VTPNAHNEMFTIASRFRPGTEHSGDVRSFIERELPAELRWRRAPYDRLKRALVAEIDEAAWAASYSNRRHPFDPPEAGKTTGS
jgi:hypothetical protein